MNINNNVVLVAEAVEGQMSALREAQAAPTSLQEVTHMSKCDIDRLVSVVSIIALYWLSYQWQCLIKTRH